jgi:hypothetical protein
MAMAILEMGTIMGIGTWALGQLAIGNLGREKSAKRPVVLENQLSTHIAVQWPFLQYIIWIILG